MDVAVEDVFEWLAWDGDARGIGDAVVVDVDAQDAGDVGAGGVGAGDAGDVSGVDPEGFAGLDAAEVAVDVAIDDDVDAGNLAAIEAGGFFVAGEAEVVVGDPEN